MSEELDELKTSINGSYDRLKAFLDAQTLPDIPAPEDQTPDPLPVEPPTKTGITRQQWETISRWINSVETGKPEGDYGNVTVYRDGKGGATKQVTLGKAQTTESGDGVGTLIRQYMKADKENLYDDGLGIYFDYPPYGLANAGDAALEPFKRAVRAASNDPDFREVQDKFFEDRYFAPALAWGKERGFEDALSYLVLVDSFIHSGGILSFLRKRFNATPDDERGWVSQYVDTRHQWLANHSRKLLRKTIYRTKSLQDEISRGNWDLSQPMTVNGININTRSLA